MKSPWILACLCLVGSLLSVGVPCAPAVRGGERLVLVLGASGLDEYADDFEQAAVAWETLANRQGWQLVRIEQPADASPREQLRQTLAATSETERLWLVLVGHGTFSQNIAKFNLIGQDVSATELANWLKPIQQQVVVINCHAASGPFITALAGKQRILVTATRSGSEINYSRFGTHLAQAINDLAADIDHDQEVSLLEAFLAAAANTQRFYEENARLATEHPLLDDNGDKAGTPADFFRGIRPIKEAADGKPVDGNTARRIVLYSAPDLPQFSAEQQRQRAEIESRIDLLRGRKSDLAEDEYFSRLEQLLLELAAVYDEVESAGQ